MKPDSAPRLYRFGPCTYAPGLRELRYGQVRVLVPLQESKVLTALLERPGELVSKTQLGEILWPNERYGEFDRAIHNLISKLRRLHPEAPRWIETVPKAGYKLSVAVETEWPPEPSPERAPPAAEPGPTPPPAAQPGPTPPATADPATHLASPPTTEPATHPASPPTTEPATHPASPPTTEPATHLASPPTTEPTTHLASLPTAAPATHLASPPTVAPATHLASPPTAAPEPGRPAPRSTASAVMPATEFVPAPALSPRSRRISRRLGAIVLASAVLGAIAWLFAGSPRPALAPPTMVGVLPFTGSGGELGESDALREQVADALARIPGAEVRAAHSLTPRMSEPPEQLQRAARQLHLDLLIAAKLDVRDQDYALNLELIRGSDGTHLSSLHYRGNRAALGALPEKVANDMTPFLRRHSADAEPQRLLGSTPSQAAYDLAFRAGAALTQRSKPEVTQAISLYERAIEVDPNFARAWSGLAETQLVMANFGDGSRTAMQFEAARRAAEQALALDPSSSQAHSTLGLILLQHDCKLEAAEQQLRSAIASNPGSAANHLRMAVLLTDRGHFAEAGAAIERAHDADPDWPVIDGTAMYVHIMARDYERAIADAEALVRSKPDWSRAHQHLGWALWYAGRHDAAVQQWQRAALLDKDAAAAALQETGARLLDQQGVRAYAEFRIASHQHQPDDDDFVLAEWYAFAGDPGHTLDELEKLVAQRSPESLKIPWNPAYDFLRSQPRFKRLVEHLRAQCA